MPEEKSLFSETTFQSYILCIFIISSASSVKLKTFLKLIQRETGTEMAGNGAESGNWQVSNLQITGVVERPGQEKIKANVIKRLCIRNTQEVNAFKVPAVICGVRTYFHLVILYKQRNKGVKIIRTLYKILKYLLIGSLQNF